jgi:NhaP-type Na+/H+ or K+/H+ antiporter
MFFNFVAFSADFSAGSLVRLGVDIAVISVIALVSCLLLMFFLEKSTHHVKFMLVLAVLVISYSLGKLYHLSTLLLIFVMGLFINNTDLFIRGRFQRWFNTSKLNIQIDLLKNVTAELAFFVRTFFFLIFGFSIHLATLADPSVILVGILILGSVLLVRYAYLRTLIGGRIMPELFIAPRGLITILLFYSIPVHHRIVNFSSGILFFVIVTSTILMSVALMATRSKELTEELLQETG